MRPFGGLRLWNELDTVLYLAQLVGYRHTGIPVKLRQYVSEAVVNEILGAAFLRFKIAEELLFHFLISDLNIEALDRHSPNIYQNCFKANYSC